MKKARFPWLPAPAHAHHTGRHLGVECQMVKLQQFHREQRLNRESFKRNEHRELEVPAGTENGWGHFRILTVDAGR